MRLAVTHFFTTSISSTNGARTQLKFLQEIMRIEGDQLLPLQNTPFGVLIFKLVIKKQKLQKEPLTLLSSCLKKS